MIGFIRQHGSVIVGLGVNASLAASHSRQLEAAAGVDSSLVFRGRSFFDPVAVSRFSERPADLGISCGFASILPAPLLAVPRWGWVNVHRSYLPYNRGLLPLQWALIDRTPLGVSLHVMTEGVDSGPVIAQEELPTLPTDNADTVSRRADEAALRLFTAAWPRLRTGDLAGRPQNEELATHHSWAECEQLRRLDLNAPTTVRRLLDTLRALSGNRGSAAYFESCGIRFSVHAEITMMGVGEPKEPRQAPHTGSEV